MGQQHAMVDTPVGALTVVVGAEGVTEISFDLSPPEGSEEDPALDAAAQLRAWVRGERRSFNLPLAPEGTAFQRGVWVALQALPFGTTSTYGELAKAVGRPVGAARAIGAANGANPIAIVVPCHRVVGADGTLTGYAGGLERKRWLLAHERAASGLPFR